MFFYSQNKIRYELRLTQLHVYVISIILLLTTSFGLKRPSSGQYLQQQKPSNAGAYSTKSQTN
jgi:hypothetical protein